MAWHFYWQWSRCHGQKFGRHWKVYDQSRNEIPLTWSCNQNGRAKGKGKCNENNKTFNHNHQQEQQCPGWGDNYQNANHRSVLTNNRQQTMNHIPPTNACPLPGHHNHIWGECYENARNPKHGLNQGHNQSQTQIHHIVRIRMSLKGTLRMLIYPSNGANK